MEDPNPYESPKTQTAGPPRASRHCEKVAKQPDYRRWAVSGIFLPAMVLLGGFAIVAGIWGGDIATRLGNRLGEIFLGYLLALALAAVSHKIIAERRSRQKNRSVDNQQARDSDAVRQNGD